MKTNIATLGYSGFCTLLSEDTEDRFRVILDYDNFQVWEDTETHEYYYLERDENDASDFFEVVLIAVLTYSSIHDINEKTVNGCLNYLIAVAAENVLAMTKLSIYGLNKENSH